MRRNGEKCWEIEVSWDKAASRAEGVGREEV